MLVSRKIQHTAELDCFFIVGVPIRRDFIERSGSNSLRTAALDSRWADFLCRGRAFSFVHVVSRGQAHSRAADLCQDQPSISLFNRGRIRRIDAGIGRHPQSRASGHGTTGINLFVELGNLPPAIGIA